MRVAFFGTPDPAVPALRELLAAPDVEVVAVVTNPDRPSGRGHRLAPPPVKVLALEAGVPVWQPVKAREILDDLVALAPDACAVVAYGSLLPRAVLEAGGVGFVNLHFSLLPAWRGAAPVQAALLAGDTETGVTCFVLEEGMDTGPILAAARTPVRDGETAGELVLRLAELGAPILTAAVRGLVEGTLTATAQDHDRATYAPKITPEDALLDWTREASVLERAVRAHNPAPGAHTTLNGARLKVYRTLLTGSLAGTRPGEVAAVEDGLPVVACGTGGLVLAEVQPAGKPRMSGADLLNGYRPLGRVLGQER